VQHRFSAPLWTTPGPTPWFFVTVPEDLSDEIDELSRGRQGGFGSVRVEVTVGSTTWRTSLFPSREHAAYVLPVKRQVRACEALAAGGPVAVALRLLDGAAAGLPG